MGEKGYLKECTLAKEFTHMHNAGGDVIAKQCYLFSVEVPVEDGTVTLPVDDSVFVFAATAHFDDAPEKALQPLYDTLAKEPFTYKRSKYEERMSHFDGILNALGKVQFLVSQIEKL